ncbi:hypothetical protein DZF83_24115 [Vibrio parahaemolyticus]|nr:hypothetical protein [Vibrio parahaemolyticus]
MSSLFTTAKPVLGTGGIVIIQVIIVESVHNKAFKSDSQRLAFFIPSLSSVFTVVWSGFVVALFTP